MNLIYGIIRKSASLCFIFFRKKPDEQNHPQDEKKQRGKHLHQHSPQGMIEINFLNVFLNRDDAFFELRMILRVGFHFEV